MPQNPLSALVATNAALAAKALLVGADQDLSVSQRHGSKYQAAAAGTLCWGANTAGVTTSAGLATTCVGLILSNPAASLKNLLLRTISGAFIVAPSVVTGIGLITGYAVAGVVTHTTPLVAKKAIIGNAVLPSGKIDSAATIVGTPAWSMVLAETPIATELPFFNLDLEGGIILPPGAYAAIGTTIAGPSSGFMGAFQWEEIAI